MKVLLLDQGLPRSTTSFLTQLNITSVHASDLGLSRASDSEILAYARQHDQIVVTLDSDFHMLLAATGAESPSVIRLRMQGMSGSQSAAVIVTVLERCGRGLDSGAVVSVTSTLMRVKLLPLTRPPQLSS